VLEAVHMPCDDEEQTKMEYISCLRTDRVEFCIVSHHYWRIDISSG
jgi:hypothetical protein